MKDYAYYNLATSFLETADYHEALYYFDKVKKLDEDEAHFFIYLQKMAYLYLKMDDMEKAKEKINDMKKILVNLNNNVDIYRIMLENLEIMIKKDYLKDSRYEETLIYLYNKVEDVLGYGLKRFYAIKWIELLKTQRKYKEALQISEIMRIS